jgi:hypothetical protein
MTECKTDEDCWALYNDWAVCDRQSGQCQVSGTD